MSWLAIPEIINKVMGRFCWDRKSIRRNRLDKLHKQELELIAEKWTAERGLKLAKIRIEIEKLHNEAKND